jgi:hypothetical protein
MGIDQYRDVRTLWMPCLFCHPSFYSWPRNLICCGELAGSYGQGPGGWWWLPVIALFHRKNSAKDLSLGSSALYIKPHVYKGSFYRISSAPIKIPSQTSWVISHSGFSNLRPLLPSQHLALFWDLQQDTRTPPYSWSFPHELGMW